MKTFPKGLSKILELVDSDGSRPFDRLERGKPSANGREAVAASGLEPLVQGALYLYFDCFEEAHDIANANEGTAAGNWIHAILHRREPDAGNSKYWYHRVKLPDEVVREIIGEILKLKGNEILRSWEPAVFVDACEKARKKSKEDQAYQGLTKIQEIEWRVLLGFVLG